MKKNLQLTSIRRLLFFCFALWGMQTAVFAQTNIIPKLFLSARNVPSGNTGWTITNAGTNNAGTDYWKMLSGSSLTSPAMDFSSYTGITVTLSLQSFGTIANNSDKIKVEYYNGTAWAQVGSLLATSSTVSNPVVSIPSTATSAVAQIRVTAPNATATAGARVFSIEIKGTIPNAAPTATDVTVSGAYSVGETLIAAYTYADAENNPEGTSTFKWYRSNDAAGTAEAAISGATASTYVLTSADSGKYIRLGVTPVATTGTLTGTESFSSRQLVVSVPVATLDVTDNDLAFGNNAVLVNSTVQSFDLSGTTLSGAPGVITVHAPNTDFEVSNNNTTWGATTTVAYSTATLAAATVYVRFIPQTSGVKTGNITFTGGGVTNPPVVSVTGTGVLNAPVASNASNIEATQFNANWAAVLGTTGYSLDVSTTPNFFTPTVILTEGFEGATFPPTGWANVTWSRSTVAGDISTGDGAATAAANNGTLTTKAVAYPTSLTFNLGRSTNSTAKTLDIEVSTTTQTGTFTNVASYTHANVPSNSYDSYTVDLSAYSSYETVYIRFKKTSSTASPWRLDNVVVNGLVSDMVTGYDGKVIAGQSTTTTVVTGLTANTEYYYRVRAISSTVTSDNSNTIAVTTAANAIWNGSAWSNVTGPTASIDAVIAGIYNTATNGAFTAKSLTINSGTFTVASGTNVTVVNAINNNLTADKFVVENNANILQSETVNNNSGNITVNRNVSAKYLDYVYWSSPVAAQNLQAFSAETLPGRFYTIDEQTNVFQDAASTTNSFSLAKGYVIRTPNTWNTAPGVQQQFSGSFAGKPNNGDITIPVTALGEGYNLIGNPYPSTVNADLFLAEPANQNIQTLYFWAHMTTVAGGTNYATYNATGAAGAAPSVTVPVSETPNGYIQTGQGFLAQVSSAGTATFTNSMRAANNSNQFFRTADVQKNRIWLNLSDAATAYNQALIGYVAGATNALDSKFDGKLIETTGTRLYNVINNSEYTIQGRALPFASTDVVAMGFKAAVAGTFTIAIDHTDGLFADEQDIFLKDNLTGTVNNLKDAAYTFASAQGTFNDRFEIVYENTVLGIQNHSLTGESIVVYKQNNILNINAGTTVMAGVKIFDIRGRLIYERNGINASSTSINNLDAVQQVLVIQITSTDNITVYKKVVY